MREIKFRAWNKVGKYYVNNVQDAYDGAGPNGPFDSFGDALDNDNYVVEQFTGLYEENGREVFEGDIVVVVSQYWGQLGNRYEVKFRKGAFYAEYVLLSEISPSISVIGNIHENMELLEVD